ncbi:MAG: DUF3291 domain-containing protein [Rhodospirillaceae bacterium]|nr:MAG: DUF3291 domain-containing protein [Rhodospirillaceae bacterium]
MMTISVTRLRLRSSRYLLPFLWYAFTSSRQARRSDGNRGVLLRRFRGAYWTMTLWRDRAAARAFMTSGPHRAAMPHLPLWCDEASLVHWEESVDALPTWEMAAQRLAAEGRVSAVTFPSLAQAAGITLGS